MKYKCTFTVIPDEGDLKGEELDDAVKAGLENVDIEDCSIYNLRVVRSDERDSKQIDYLLSCAKEMVTYAKEEKIDIHNPFYILARSMLNF